MPQYLICLLLLLPISVCGQSFEALPFAEVVPTTEAEVKKEIDRVITNFREREAQMDLNFKSVDTKKCNNDRICRGRIYTQGGKLIKIEYPGDLGANAHEHLFYDRHGKLRIILSSSHGGNWVENRFSYIGNGRIWGFIYGKREDKSIEEALRMFYEDEPTHLNYDEALVTKTRGWYEDIKKEMLEKYELESIDPWDLKYFKGKIDFEYPIIMELNFEEDGSIHGRYRYQSGSGDLQLTGTLIEERFTLEEKDGKGQVTGRFKGYFREKDEIWGKWYSPDGKKELDLRLYTFPDYTFEDP